MAYDTGDRLVVVEGMTGATESWSNTWAFGNVALEDEAAVVAALHSFYEDLTLTTTLNATWSSTNATLRRLLAQQSETVTWAPLTGGNATSLAPTQLAVRVSLNSVSGINGGPYLGGWSVGSIQAGGLLLAGDQADIATALTDLNAAIVLANSNIAIHRPTTQTLVVASRGRIGQRFDVMRSRSNDTSEAYDTVDLT